MKYFPKIALLLVLSLTLSFVSSFALVSADEYSDDPGITSGNVAIAYCIDEEQFLYADRIDEKVAPAVATKLVNCMVVMDILKENGLTLDDQVTVTKAALDNAYDGRYGDISFQLPVMLLKAGNTCSVKDLLSSTLVVGANDAAAALACHYGEKYLGGGITEFVARMNEKVKELGLENTRFTNPTGFDSPEQYTTPREVAYIASAFYQYNELVTLSDVVDFRFGGERLVRSRNFLKNEFYVGGYLNKSAISIIAGQLNKRGNYCLIAASQKEGKTYIYVVMCATGIVTTEIEPGKFIQSIGDGNAYTDMNKLISWSKSAFKMLEVATTETIVGELRVHLGEKNYVIVVPAEKVEKLVPDVEGGELSTSVIYDTSVVYKKDFNGKEYDTVNAPITAGQRVGSVTYTYNGVELATVDIVAKEGIAADTLKASLDSAKNIMNGVLTALYVVIGIIALYVVTVIIIKIVKASEKKKSKKPLQKTASYPKKGTKAVPKNPKSQRKTVKTNKTQPKRRELPFTDTRDFD